MLAFYQALSSNWNPAQALQTAAIQAIQKRRELVSWAGYELTGSGRSLMP
jgi:CHAT domain-containing protein